MSDATAAAGSALPQASVPSHPPNPWVAAALTLLGAGTGQVYAGRALRGMCVGAGALAFVRLALHLMTDASLSRALWLATAAPALVLAVVVLPLAAVWDAARTARRAREVSRRRWQRWLAAFAYVVAFSFASTSLTGFDPNRVPYSLYVPSEAMLPTLLIGDHLFTDRSAYRSREPRRGDVVVVLMARSGRDLVPADREPQHPKELFVKRIVGIPGDVIETDGAALTVNGRRATGDETVGELTDDSGRRLVQRDEELDGSRYRILDDPAIPSNSGAGSFTVEPGRYFLLGDNRDNSYDSRFFGTIARDDVLAPIGRVYWSWPYTRPTAELLAPGVLAEAWRGVRWARIGTFVSSAPR